MKTSLLLLTLALLFSNLALADSYHSPLDFFPLHLKTTEAQKLGAIVKQEQGQAKVMALGVNWDAKLFFVDNKLQAVVYTHALDLNILRDLWQEYKKLDLKPLFMDTLDQRYTFFEVEAEAKNTLDWAAKALDQMLFVLELDAGMNKDLGDFHIYSVAPAIFADLVAAIQKNADQDEVLIKYDNSPLYILSFDKFSKLLRFTVTTVQSAPDYLTWIDPDADDESKAQNAKLEPRPEYIFKPDTITIRNEFKYKIETMQCDDSQNQVQIAQDLLPNSVIELQQLGCKTLRLKLHEPRGQEFIATPVEYQFSLPSLPQIGQGLIFQKAVPIEESQSLFPYLTLVSSDQAIRLAEGQPLAPLLTSNLMSSQTQDFTLSFADSTWRVSPNSMIYKNDQLQQITLTNSLTSGNIGYLISWLETEKIATPLSLETPTNTLKFKNAAQGFAEIKEIMQDFEVKDLKIICNISKLQPLEYLSIIISGSSDLVSVVLSTIN